MLNKHMEVTRLKMDFGSKAIQREVEAQDKSQAISLRFVENKGQLDAIDWILLQNVLSAQYVSGTVMPIIRSSRIIHMVATCDMALWFTGRWSGVEL